jgi:hypothetical protein
MAKGISTRGDALVTQTADGVDLNDIWDEVARVLDLYNKERSAVVSLLSYRTTQVADAVPQSISSESLEEVSEYGLPRAVRPPSDVIKLGYQMRTYDIALRSTWQYLRSATSEQVVAGVTTVLEADNKKTSGMILQRLFNPTVEINDWQQNCYGLWNADGMKPPPFLGKTFASDHTHYVASQSTVIDSQDIELMIRHVKEHGYGTKPGSQMLIFAHPDDVDAAAIPAWRAGLAYRTGGPLPQHDFVPSSLMPAWISDETVHGTVPAADFNGLPVLGSYAGALLIQSYFVPVGYVAVTATSGPNSDLNPVAFREDKNPDYAGLLHVGGPGVYPLQESMFVRSFGVGVRHRGGAIVCQITSGSTYAAPAAGAIPL